MRFEIKKLLTNKIIVVLFALFVIAGFARYAIDAGVFIHTGYWAEFDGDAMRRQSDYYERYNDQCERFIRSSKRIASESSDRYTANLSNKVASVCEKRSELPPGDNRVINAFRWGLSDISVSLLLAIFCVLISAELFCCDRTTGVYRLNFTAKNGRLVLYKNKVLALMLCSACTAVVFTLAQVAAVLPKYALSSINTPIQVDETFANCAFNMGFLELIFVTVIIRILMCWFICFLTACLALAIGHLIVSSVVSTGLCVLLYVLYDRTLSTHIVTQVMPTKYVANHILKKFSPICLVDPTGYLYSRDYVNVFGFPVAELHFNIFITVIMTAALAALGAFLFIRKRRAVS